MRTTSTFDSVLQGVIECVDPAVHIFFGWGLVHSLVLRCNDFEAESSLSIASLSDGSHSQIYRLHMQIESLLPVAVFGKLALVKHDPESSLCK